MAKFAPRYYRRWKDELTVDVVTMAGDVYGLDTKDPVATLNSHRGNDVDMFIEHGKVYNHPAYENYRILIPCNREYSNEELPEVATLVGRMSNTDQFDHAYEWFIAVAALYRIMRELPLENPVCILVTPEVYDAHTSNLVPREGVQAMKDVGVVLVKCPALSTNPNRPMIITANTYEGVAYYDAMPEHWKSTFALAWDQVGVDYRIYLPPELHHSV